MLISLMYFAVKNAVLTLNYSRWCILYRTRSYLIIPLLHPFSAGACHTYPQCTLVTAQCHSGFPLAYLKTLL